MRKEIKKALDESLAANQENGGDGDHSEAPANLFSNLNSDDGEPYDEDQDSTPELKKQRIHDK